jgi:hypothetical protein
MQHTRQGQIGSITGTPGYFIKPFNQFARLSEVLELLCHWVRSSAEMIHRFTRTASNQHPRASGGVEQMVATIGQVAGLTELAGGMFLKIVPWK